MRKLWKDYGLLITMFGLFAVFAAGLSAVGLAVYNQDQLAHGQAAVGFVQFLDSGQFREALAENWESEFLEMGVYVVLTSLFCARGAAESKPPDEAAGNSYPSGGRHPSLGIPEGEGPQHGLPRWLYEHSLGLALLGLFALCIIAHGYEGARAYDEDQLAHHQAALAHWWHFYATPTFWFQALQNWQSEFLGVGTMITLSIFLREKGSPQSKPVDAPDGATGEEAR